jgi:macrodomain Ter protein organizer (MatP/YcbG family)
MKLQIINLSDDEWDKLSSLARQMNMTPRQTLSHCINTASDLLDEEKIRARMYEQVKEAMDARSPLRDFGKPFPL